MEGFNELRIEQQRLVDGQIFPICLQSFEGTTSTKASTIEAIVAQRDKLDNLLRTHRGILFRNVGINSVDDFHDFIIASGLEGSIKSYFKHQLAPVITLVEQEWSISAGLQ